LNWHRGPALPESKGWIARRARAGDLGALVDLCKAHAEFERVGYDAAGKADRLWQALANHPPRLHAWVCSSGHDVAGYATATREYSTWNACEYLHLDCLFIRADARGAGLGARLLQAVIAFARDSGLPQLQWQTPEWNLDACRFYLRHGGIARPKSRFTLDIAMR
jgi:GNAT superfamily N-acetyltransferase